MASISQALLCVICQLANWHVAGAQPRLGEGFYSLDHICGHTSELHWDTQPIADADLLQVQVVHRHGARTLWRTMSCWAPAPDAVAGGPAFGDCTSLPMAFAVGEQSRLVKRYDQPGGCGVGSLLPEANEQFRAGAASLNASYGHVPWWNTLDPTDPSSVRLYSCDNDRNLGSLDMLVNHLFPGRSSESPLNVHTRPAAKDPWEVSSYGTASPCSAQAHNAPATERIRADPAFARFTRRWRDAANATWNRDHWDCITTSRCSHIELPSAISTELANEALKWGFLAVTAPMRSTNWTSLWVSAALQNLTNHFDSATRTASAPRLLLWSTHDLTMMYVLQALSAWDGRWPAYASMISLELYRERDRQDQHFVRVLRGGEPLRLGACGGKVQCPLNELKDVVQHWYEAAWADCSAAGVPAPFWDIVDQPRHPAEPIPGLEMLQGHGDGGFILLLIGVFFAGVTLQMAVSSVVSRLIRRAGAGRSGSGRTEPLLSCHA